MDWKLKTVVGHWADYYICKNESRVFFKIGSQKVAVSHLINGYYTLYYKWLVTDVSDGDINDTLDLYEAMLKGMN